MDGANENLVAEYVMRVELGTTAKEKVKVHIVSPATMGLRLVVVVSEIRFLV